MSTFRIAARASASAVVAPVRLGAVPVPLALGGVVAASALVRIALAPTRVTPTYFPDEFLYSALAERLAGVTSLELGNVLGFAVLQPLLLSPLWRLADPELAYALTKVANALVMSTAAVPAYLLARRLGMSTRLAVGLGALTVSAPAMRYSSFVLAEPLAYPLVLAAVYAAVRALDEPTWRNQLVFSAFAALVAVARAQYAIVFPAYLVAALLVERGRPRRALAASHGVAVAGALLAVAAGGLGAGRLLGAYAGAVAVPPEPGAFLRWFAADALLSAYAVGWVIVPGAAVAAAALLMRPVSRSAAAFAAVAAALGSLLLVEAAYVAAIDSDRFQERYLLPLFPLAALLFATPGSRPRWAAAGVVPVGLLLALAAAHVPLTQFTAAHGPHDSPTLAAVAVLERALSSGNGALAAALVAGGLAIASVPVAMRRRPAAGLVLAGAVALVVSVGAARYDAITSRALRDAALPGAKSWVDAHAGGRPVVLLETPYSSPAHSFTQLFWNRSVDVVVPAAGETVLGRFPAHDPGLAADGRLARLAAGERLLLVDGHGSLVAVRGARRLAHGGAFTLWSPGPEAALSLLVSGRYADGRLAAVAELMAWPAPGARSVELELDEAAGRRRVVVDGAGVHRTVEVAGGRRVLVRLPLTGERPVRFRARTRPAEVLPDGRVVGVRLLRIRFVADTDEPGGQ